MPELCLPAVPDPQSGGFQIAKLGISAMIDTSTWDRQRAALTQLRYRVVRDLPTTRGPKRDKQDLIFSVGLMYLKVRAADATPGDYLLWPATLPGA